MPDPTEFKQVLDRIYQENPAYWPHGLNRGQLDEAYLIRDPVTKRAAGFSGWQFRRDDLGKRAGYYAVGILPEFRRQGLAKQALQEMFREHRPADVQDIRAFIVPGNEPSMQLAAQLGVQVQHKQAALRLTNQSSMLGKMARSTAYVPNHYSGLSLQQFMPLAPRRDKLSPAEQAAVQEGSSQWFPAVFKSMADSPAVDMSSPGKGALMAALAGGGVGAGAAHFLNASKTHTALAGGGAGILSGVLAYLHRKAQNSSTEEMMKRLPVNSTRRDMLADPVIQQELNRDSQTGASEEALRTAQLLAVLQATSKQASVKLAAPRIPTSWLGGIIKNNPRTAQALGGIGGAAAWDAALNHEQYTDAGSIPRRALLGTINAIMLGKGIKPKGNLGAQLIQIPTKDLAVAAGVNGMPALLSAAKHYVNGGNPAPAPPAQPSLFDQASNWVAQNPGTAAVGGLAGAGVLAGAGYLAHRATQVLQSLANRAEHPETGRIRVTLPTKNRGDAETQIDMPVQQLDMSNALFGKIRRDFRNRLRAETNARTHRRELSDEERQRRAALLATYR